MKDQLTSATWATERGDKWRSNVTGMEATLAPIDAPLLEAAALGGATRIADVACGGGGTTLAAFRRAPAGAVVQGFDIAAGLVEYARTRRGPDEQAVTFEVADLTTVVPAQPFDRVLSRFGTMFFPEPDAAFHNLARWLQPGGRLALAVWSTPADNPWMSLVRDVVGTIVELPPVDPSAPGPMRYGDVTPLLDLLAGAGLVDIASRDWRGELRHGGGLPAPAAARFALGAFGDFAERLAAAGESAVADAQAQLTARFAPHERDGAVALPATVHVVTATRPR